MKLQVSLDLYNGDQAVKVAQNIKEYADIIEVGTPVIMLDGVHAVRKMKDAYPDKTILADTKIADGATIETQYAIDAGADIVTVLALAHDNTIKDCIETAHASGVKVLVDMISVTNIEVRAKEVSAMGADYISVHTAADAQSKDNNPLKDLSLLAKSIDSKKIACAGGINLNTIDEIMSYNPEIIIIGGAITNTEKPESTAKEFYEIIQRGVL